MDEDEVVEVALLLFVVAVVTGLPILKIPIVQDLISQSENVPPARLRKQIAEFVEDEEKTLALMLGDDNDDASPHFSNTHFDTFVFVISWNVVDVDDNGGAAGFPTVVLLILLLLLIIDEAKR